ncbi:SURP and G-patch domain-containing protein 1-like [Topomyia yanbarensis]|uniref:SURP and G-patch domain-containing protein 1-like n=1 Tax=Topomyia yanbarensis TaxID=2498891 RepID=UPI00273CEA00|nr:SURP and G-patch domain-containing protein 1-like [Topomyia yanbarensis]
MPRVNFTRTDRIAQMSQQEQLIAQKRQQILEKQRTLQMAKQIVAEASKNNAGAEETEPDKPGGLKIPFSNDGSFLENFKKLSEKIAKTTEDQNKRAAEDDASNSEKKLKTEEVLVTIPPPPPPPAPPIPPTVPSIPVEVAYAAYYNITQPPPMMTLMQSAPLPPPTIPDTIADTAPLIEPTMDIVETVQPPVLEQVPEVGANCKVFSENDKLPTTVEELVELVADIGDVYEEKLSSRKNELHPSLWFLFDKQSEAYRNYRHMIVARLFKTAGIEHALPPPQPFIEPETAVDDSKYDPEDVLDDTNMEDDPNVLVDQKEQQNDEPIQMRPNYYGDEQHFYDDKSTTETDSDTEYVREARKRNLKNLKRKTMNAGNVREDSTTDTDDDFGESSEGKQDANSEKGANSNGGKTARQKHKKKTRWGDNVDSTEGNDLIDDSKGSADASHNSTTANSELPSSSYGAQPQHPNSRLNPGLLQFVFQCFGTVDVSPESWKQAEEHFRIRLLYEDMSNKIQIHERFTSNRLMRSVGGGQMDAEEDLRLNSDKMKAVLLWINEITTFYDRFGAANLEEFLLRDEYESFIDKFRKITDRQPNFEDYKKFKLEQAKIVSTNSRGEYSSTDSDFVGVKNSAVENMDELEQSSFALDDSEKNAKRRKSRWGDQVEKQSVHQAPAATTPAVPAGGPSSSKYNAPKLSTVGRTDPALLAYVRQNFGTTVLSEEDWKKAEDHYKINLLYQDMLRKRQEIDRLASSGKFKYEYDSDEDTTGGTWEHKLRSQEMEATQLWANELTIKSEGKHHIGDFLPPEELRKFMEKYDAQKNNRLPNISDYKEYKLTEDNVGFQMLQKLGWKEGQGLGTDGSGIVDPINKASQRDNNQGLGVAQSDNPEVDDNEYDAYRKRMMLAYRFRPNPLNNPRRAYY